MRPISCALYSGLDQFTGHSLGVSGQAQEAHNVDEAGGQVHFDAELAGCVVVRERVVVIVEALAYCTEGYKSVLPGVDAFVIRSVAPHVSGTVDQPCGVEYHRVPQQGGDEVGHQKGLAPKVPRHHGGDEEAHDHHGRLVVFPLKHYDFVSIEIFQLQLASLLDDVGVFADQEPADVREEEPSFGVVRVCV